MRKSVFILKGNIVYSKKCGQMEVCRRGYLVCRDGVVEGVYRTLPFRLGGYPVKDYGECLIIPGITDLHTHAPQYTFRGTGMDMELLDWLETYTFPEESKYKDMQYANEAYRIFADDLRKSAVTRACIFATVHKDATLLLMDMLEKTGLCTMVGKVNMDRNGPKSLIEKTEVSISETEKWIREAAERKYQNTMPVITPRFIPSCSDGLLTELKKIQKKYELPVQSHLSENPGEISWVKKLCPWAEDYGDAYEHFGFFGGDCRTVMAHCVYSGEKELEKIRNNGVFIAHCPESNMNVSSGIAPVRRFLEQGIHVGLGSDAAAGTTINPFRAMVSAVQVSKLKWRMEENSPAPLTFEEVFFIATKGGGSFFGKTGSFEAGYAFDAIVLDDSRIKTAGTFDERNRLERLIYLGDEREITAKFVNGKETNLS